jgi:hypothetical protein
MKYRIFTSRFKTFAIVCFFFHLCVCSSLFIFPVVVPLQPLPTVQEFNENQTLKIIEGCVIALRSDLETMYWLNLTESLAPINTAVQVVYFVALPILLQLSNLLVLMVVIRKHIKTMGVLLHESEKVGGVNYIRVLKMTILLGILFFLQELPLAIFQITVATDRYMKMNVAYLLYVSVSFVVIKPLNFLTYASQSRRKLLKMFCPK